MASALRTIPALDQPPVTGDSASAREVPMPGDVRPIAKPLARSSRTRARFSSAGPATAPRVPEIRVSTAASGTEAPRVSALDGPTGQVTERGQEAGSKASPATKPT